MLCNCVEPACVLRAFQLTAMRRLLYLLLLVANLCGASEVVDPRGYVVYCPCMGRFGNQADHFLGALSFAKHLDRTLLLPPWVEYVQGYREAQMKSFGAYFDVTKLAEYHRVMLMEDFMVQLADSVWPPDKRKELCWTPRQGVYNKESIGCNAKDGNPFGPFWDHHQIEFTGGSEYFAQKTGGYRTQSARVRQMWDDSYPPSEFPVLAFVGAPANFPVEKENIVLHKYLHWSADIQTKAAAFIAKHLSGGPWIGIHLRNDLDWVRVCENLQGDTDRHLFASPQCLGYGFEHGKLTPDICQPSRETILREVSNAVDKYAAKTVFVSSDRDPMLQVLALALQSKQVSVVEYPSRDAHVSLAILARSTYYIGNCVSSFSAFAARQRVTQGLGPNGFWSFGQQKPVRTDWRKSEL